MKKKSKLIITSTLSMICLCILGAFIPAVTARDAFAPSWLKEGAYATYVSIGEEGGQAQVFDTTDPRFEGIKYMFNGYWKKSGDFPVAFDWLYYRNASLTWRCVSVNDTMAKLQVTFDCIGEKLEQYAGVVEPTEEPIRTPLNGESWQRSGDAYVDLYTRAVYNANGAFLGTTHLWLPANPSEGQEIVVWDAEPKTIALPITMNPGCKTIQGTQDTFMFVDSGFIPDDTEPNSCKSILLFYDLDTGLAVAGLFSWDPVFAAIGIGDGGLVGTGSSETAFYDTNIDFGPQRTTINWTQILQYSILPIAVVLLVAAFVIRRKKKRN
jgi:hypothetical protein